MSNEEKKKMIDVVGCNLKKMDKNNIVLCEVWEPLLHNIWVHDVVVK